MDQYYYLPETIHQGTKAMMFIDGENLAIRYKETIGNATPEAHVTHIPDVLAWTRRANIKNHLSCEVVRRYYYTSTVGDEMKRVEIQDTLKGLGIEQPRVFGKAKGKRSKRVDIT